MLVGLHDAKGGVKPRAVELAVVEEEDRDDGTKVGEGLSSPQLEDRRSGAERV